MDSKQANVKAVAPSAAPPPPVRYSAAITFGFLAVAAAIAAAISLFAALNTTAALGLVAIPFVAAVFYAVYRHPIWVLYFFIIFLPLHFLFLVILYVQLGLPANVVRAVASWKEILLFGTLAIVAFSALARGRAPRLTWIDTVAVAWLLLLLLYALFHDLFFDWESSLIVRVYGLRDWLLYIVPFFIGRLVPISERQTRTVLKLILYSGAFVSVVGLIDYFFIPVSAHISLGVARYYNEIYNQSWNTQLPYWTYLPGLGNTRRLTSYMFSGQNFALSFLILIPVMVYNYRARLTKWRGLILAAGAAALLLSITRATIVVCALQAVIVLWMTGAKRTVLYAGYALAWLILVALIVSPNLRDYVVGTLTFTEASAATRPQQWKDGIASTIAMPFGYGIGSTGLTSSRMGVQISAVEGSETAYLKITGALGFHGLLLWLAWFTGIILASSLVVRRTSGLKRGFAVITIAIAIGFMLNNFTAPPDQSLFVIYVFPWMAGIVVRWATQITAPVLHAQPVQRASPASGLRIEGA